MEKIALIHTVQSVLNTFESDVKKVIKNVKITNILDEFLASDTGEKGEFTMNNKNRLFQIIKCAEMTEADAIVVTCSTLSEVVEDIRGFVHIPIITIDSAMITRAVELGTNITVMATAESTLAPTTNKLLKEAKRINKEININVICCPEAYSAIKNGNNMLHNEILKRKALEIKQQDVVVLAQASMAHMDEKIEKIAGSIVLSSPKLCINELKEILRKNN